MSCVPMGRNKEASVSTEGQKVVDGYLGLDDPVTVYALISTGLRNLGFSEDKANRYAWFCQAIYKELKDSHDVMDGMQKIASANKLMPGAVAMNFGWATGVLKDYRLSARASVVAPFIDRLAAIARQNGIELNECSLSVTKVALDIAGAGTGAISAVSGIGIPLLVLSVLATYNDSYGLARACSTQL